MPKKSKTLCVDDLRHAESKRTKAATRQEQIKRTSQILGVELLMM